MDRDGNCAACPDGFDRNPTRPVTFWPEFVAPLALAARQTDTNGQLTPVNAGREFCRNGECGHCAGNGHHIVASKAEIGRRGVVHCPTCAPTKRRKIS